MMYPFMTLNDGTVDGSENVKVYFERPVNGGFDSAECYLPSYEWKNIVGYSDKEIQYFQEFLESTAHIIIGLAREGGFDNAANI